MVKSNIRWRAWRQFYGESLPHCDTRICNVQIVDGTGADPYPGELAIAGGVVERIGDLSGYTSDHEINGEGKLLAPGFIDAHTHDDLYAIRAPDMLPKLSQGVTTVIAGNCGFSASPVTLNGQLTPPMNLLGEAETFLYSTFRDYVSALREARPMVNVAALVGHTSLRNNVMDRLDRAARPHEILAMRFQLEESLEHGALGLSTGLAYSAANAAPTAEVMELAEVLHPAQAIYTTHIRTESD